MKYFVVTFILSVIPNIVFASDAKACQAKYISENQLQYTYKNNQISVIGWTHDSMSDITRGMDAIRGVTESAIAVKCDQAQKILQTYVDGSQDRLKESEAVLKKMEQLYAQKPFAVVGVEWSPSEWSTLFDKITNEHRLDRFLKTLNVKCGNLKHLSEQVSKILAPEFYFSKKNRLVIWAMEDEKLKAASLKGVSAETMNFDPDKETLTAKCKTLIYSIQIGIKKGQIPTDEEIRAVVEAETNPNQKAKLQRVFKETKQILSFIDQRNEYIAAKAVDENKNVVIIIGNSHVKGLGEELDKLCQASLAVDKSMKVPESQGVQ